MHGDLKSCSQGFVFECGLLFMVHNISPCASLPKVSTAVKTCFARAHMLQDGCMTQHSRTADSDMLNL